MFCPECGTQVDKGKFCPECGEPLAPGAAGKAPTEAELAPEETIWEGVSNSLTDKAAAGKATKGRYRITNRTVYHDVGMLQSSTTQWPLTAVSGVDVRQSLVQKARGVGDVLIWILQTNGSRRAVTLASIDEPRRIQELILHSAEQAKREYHQRAQTRYFGNSPG